jgi:hypothetical protein
MKTFAKEIDVSRRASAPGVVVDRVDDLSDRETTWLANVLGAGLEFLLKQRNKLGKFQGIETQVFNEMIVRMDGCRLNLPGLRDQRDNLGITGWFQGRSPLTPLREFYGRNGALVLYSSTGTLPAHNLSTS